VRIRIFVRQSIAERNSIAFPATRRSPRDATYLSKTQTPVRLAGCAMRGQSWQRTLVDRPDIVNPVAVGLSGSRIIQLETSPQIDAWAVRRVRPAADGERSGQIYAKQSAKCPVSMMELISIGRLAHLDRSRSQIRQTRSARSSKISRDWRGCPRRSNLSARGAKRGDSMRQEKPCNRPFTLTVTP
jgi:hypothetical protein